MRFLILTQYFPPEIGAPQVRLVALARELRYLGHSVEIVTAFPHHLVGRTFASYDGMLYLEDELDGFRVHRTWIYPATGMGSRRLLNYLSFTISSFMGLVRSQRPDFIFVESPPLFLGMTGWMYGSLKRVPMIFNVSDLWPDSVRELGVLHDGFRFQAARALERWIYRVSCYVNATTTGIMDTLIDKKRVPAAKVLFLPNGVDTKLFQPLPVDCDLKRRLRLEGKNVILYAGTHGSAQGLEIIVHAAKLLEDTNIAFLLVGEGHAKATLIKSVSDMGLTNVVFLAQQPVETMPRIFSLAVASVVPLLKRKVFKGARPSKIFASLACGVPVIFSGEGESADLITQNRVGLVTPPEDATKLANVTRYMVENIGERAAMSENARRLAEKKFSWGKIVGDWLEQLSERQDLHGRVSDEKNGEPEVYASALNSESS